MPSQSRCDRLREVEQGRLQEAWIDHVVLEGVLVADALGRLARNDARRVFALGAPRELAAVLAEPPLKGGLRQRGKLPDPLDAEVAQRLLSLGADAP